jgi:hypothetical protein
MRKSNPNFAHLAKLISADVSLASGLIKTVNSPYFGFRNRVIANSGANMCANAQTAPRNPSIVRFHYQPVGA